jgi:hypothetical protein
MRVQEPSKLAVRDCYGFAWSVTVAQQAERERCEEAVRRREAKWEKYNAARRFPKLEKLKRYLRKVKARSQNARTHALAELSWAVVRKLGGWWAAQTEEQKGRLLC